MGKRTPRLDVAIEEYLGWATVHRFKPGSGSRRPYGSKLSMYARHFGPETPVGSITGQQWYAACNQLWAASSAETYNLGRRVAMSFLEFCRACEPPYTTATPPALWKPRPVVKSRERWLSQSTVSSLYDTKYPLRERTLWSLLYDSSERLSAVLGLNVQQLSREGCYAQVRIKGGDTRAIAWSPVTCELLNEYLGDREWGPVFLTHNRPWNWRQRPADDIGPGGRCRLSAHRARIIYRELTGISGVHRVRHARLNHLATGGVNSVMMRGISGHLTDKMLAHYASPNVEAIAAFMAASMDDHPAMMGRPG